MRRPDSPRRATLAWRGPFRLVAAGLVAAAWAALAVPAAAQEALPDEVTRLIREWYDDDRIRTFDGATDLNGDGRPEIVVYVVGLPVCGTGGCNLLVFTPTDAGYRLVSDIGITRPPIRASSTVSAGWRHLVVHIAGGGVASAEVELLSDGRSYPENPTVRGPRVRPAELAGSELLIDAFRSWTEGRPLAAVAPAAATPDRPVEGASATRPPG